MQTLSHGAARGEAVWQGGAGQLRPQEVLLRKAKRWTGSVQMAKDKEVWLVNVHSGHPRTRELELVEKKRKKKMLLLHEN